MAAQQPAPAQGDPDFDRRDGDPVYHQAPPADSGSAGSFDARHNEFPPGLGHPGAAHDPRTGAPVHGDGLPYEEVPRQWQSLSDDQDPSADQDPIVEPEADSAVPGEADPREVDR